MTANLARTALVTGAGGFIASHLVESLLADGWSVRCLIRYSSSGEVGFLRDLPPEDFERLDIMRGDLLDTDFVAECCRDIDTVFHLGARISIPYSYTAPRDTFEVNAVGTLNVAEAVRHLGVKRLIHVSTSEVFGSAVSIPMSESHRLKAQSPYAASKIAADKIVESYVCSFSLPAVIVRPFNTYGPRQSPRAVIPRIMEQALRGGPIKIGSLWPRRDFTYVDDTVRGFIKAATVDEALYGEFNLGTGTDINIGELAEQILEIAGLRSEIISEDQRQRPPESEVARLLSDNLKARKVLGWEPQVPLAEGLRRVHSWWRERAPVFGWGDRPN